jgi:Putative zinc-finger
MQPFENHIDDRDLLLAAGGELSTTRAGEVREHLAGCPSCRMRKASLEQTLADVSQAQSELDAQLPPMEVSRRLLRARLAQAAEPSRPVSWPRHRLAWAAAVLLVAGMGAMLTGWPARRARPLEAEFAPNSVLTPGEVRPLTRDAVCSAPDRDAPGPPISAAVAHEVFRRYGIRNPRPRSYEVDYLIPPALGGSGDSRNLWPQPYSAGVWNARVKDALEDRLRALVCGGNLDLATAQRDLARDWIAAYKKYFRTGTPLLDHVAFVKDRPWE